MYPTSATATISAPSLQFPEKFQPLFEPYTYKVMYGGRGGARSWSCARALLLMCLERRLIVLCAREFQNSIDESVHRVISQQIELMGLDRMRGVDGSPLFRVEKAKIYGPNGSEFSFIGIKHNTSKVKSFEGVDICWIEEAQALSKASWEIIDPTIRKKGSQIWLTFNPDLETDFSYQYFVVNPRPNSVLIYTTWRDNPWFENTELAEKRLTALGNDPSNPDDDYLNVWEGKTKKVLNGAVYAKELRRADLEDRIVPKNKGGVPYSRLRGVHTFWDLGRADTMCCWFVQQFPMEFRVIDYYEARQQDLDHYFKILQNKSYVYDTHWLPHDASSRGIVSKLTVEEQFKEHWPKLVKVVPKVKLNDGIQALRTIFPQIVFDAEKCADGLQALRHYKYKVEDGQLSRNPEHDWASHAADALRYMAVGLREARPKPKLNLRERVSKLVGHASAQSWMR